MEIPWQHYLLHNTAKKQASRFEADDIMDVPEILRGCVSQWWSDLAARATRWCVAAPNRSRLPLQ
jgi:hypothetical protein